MPDFWLDAKLLISAPDMPTAKRLLDEALQDWARRSMPSSEDHGGPGVDVDMFAGPSGLVMFDRTGLCEEETK